MVQFAMLACARFVWYARIPWDNMVGDMDKAFCYDKVLESGQCKVQWAPTTSSTDNLIPIFLALSCCCIST